ncbi:MAG: SDR family oxidoreductase [Clostridia bacterium]|nr:SDR family oxidoreductase [Clostridia bacterium]
MAPEGGRRPGGSPRWWPARNIDGERKQALSRGSDEVNPPVAILNCYEKEIAGIIHFLASDEASFITGAVAPVNGGLTL